MERNRDINRMLADYIYNDLGQEDIMAIEREISNDPVLSESYQLNMQVKEYLKAKLQLEEMRSDPQLGEAERLAGMAFDTGSHFKEEEVPDSGGSRRKRIRRLTIAAAVAATVALVVSIGIIPLTTSQDKLFDRYYEPFNASANSQRGVSSDIYRDIASGINDYMDGQYSQSIDRFNEMTAVPDIQPEVQLFTALSYMGLGQYRDAQNILESVVNSNNRYQPESIWYLGLCYLKTGEFEKAGTLLAQLENYDGLYKRNARSLRKRLRRFSR